jgi:hypothetical protein
MPTGLSHPTNYDDAQTIGERIESPAPEQQRVRARTKIIHAKRAARSLCAAEAKAGADTCHKVSLVGDVEEYNPDSSAAVTRCS